MFERLSRSWSIFKRSLALIAEEKKLLIFPVISFLMMLLLVLLIVGGGVTLLMLSPETASEAAEQAQTAENAEAPISESLSLAIYFVLYFITMLVSNFCSTAFFSEIFLGLHGANVSVIRGFKTASSRLPALLMWTLLASTVGVVFKAIEQRAGLIGALVIKLIGVVWAVASCFAIPAIALDSDLKNPFTALKRSACAIKNTWGESLVGFVGIGAISMCASLFAFTGIILTLILCAMAGTQTAWIGGISMIALIIIALLAFSYLVGVAQTIYRAALYLYAEGELVPAFSEEDMAIAFKYKK